MMMATDMSVLADGDKIFTIPNVLTAEECDAFIRLTEKSGYDAAPITTAVGFLMRPQVRSNTRVMIDDPAHAAWLWGRVAPFMHGRLGPFRAVGLNERFRYYRYDPGQFFRWHGDGAFIRSENERSLFTLMVYLNDDFEGGTTDFRIGFGHADRKIAPRRGMALVFEHSLLHQGAPVESGRKYVMRTDVMYRIGG